MNTASERLDALRFWGLGILAVLLCAGTTFGYFQCMANGIVAGDLIGLRGREGDVIVAQRWARFWFATSVCCLGVSGLAGALATSIYEEAEWLRRFVGRLVVSTAASFVVAVIIGLVTVSMVTASHHSVVR